ncbi:hypothetical protein DVH02_32350 [Streptomyces corynorhini]|uniref:Uncharacterized protein n=1 Tax=Streptomyces corynorhini TaxID=2282652 RepID=A0A370ASQ5_9ACTN|nr:hypothetical protein DVH02_32350 [Streptomyces corynorhini]
MGAEGTEGVAAGGTGLSGGGPSRPDPGRIGWIHPGRIRRIRAVSQGAHPLVCQKGGRVRMVVDRLIIARRRHRRAPRGAYSPLPWLTALRRSICEFSRSLGACRDSGRFRISHVHFQY